jgi:hypothetical protein
VIAAKANYNQISTHLPAHEDAFLNGKPETTLPLDRVLEPGGIATLSPFGGVVLMASFFGRNRDHLHPRDEEVDEDDLNGAFWKRHHNLNHKLLNVSQSLPQRLRLSAPIHDINIIFANTNVYAATISLHQAAIIKAEAHNLPRQTILESKQRCIDSADQIASIMRLVNQVDLVRVSDQRLRAPD